MSETPQNQQGLLSLNSNSGVDSKEISIIDENSPSLPVFAKGELAGKKQALQIGNRQKQRGVCLPISLFLEQLSSPRVGL